MKYNIYVNFKNARYNKIVIKFIKYHNKGTNE